MPSNPLMSDSEMAAKSRLLIDCTPLIGACAKQNAPAFQKAGIVLTPQRLAAIALCEMYVKSSPWAKPGVAVEAETQALLKAAKHAAQKTPGWNALSDEQKWAAVCYAYRFGLASYAKALASGFKAVAENSYVQNAAKACNYLKANGPFAESKLETRWLGEELAENLTGPQSRKKFLQATMAALAFWIPARLANAYDAQDRINCDCPEPGDEESSSPGENESVEADESNIGNINTEQLENPDFDNSGSAGLYR